MRKSSEGEERKKSGINARGRASNLANGKILPVLSYRRFNGENVLFLSFSLALSLHFLGAFFPMCSRPLVFVARTFFRAIEL